jgi:hypothetical protein
MSKIRLEVNGAEAKLIFDNEDGRANIFDRDTLSLFSGFVVSELDSSYIMPDRKWWTFTTTGLFCNPVKRHGFLVHSLNGKQPARSYRPAQSRNKFASF